jgi:hypothetical protein
VRKELILFTFWRLACLFPEEGLHGSGPQI